MEEDEERKNFAFCGSEAKAEKSRAYKIRFPSSTRF